MLPEILTKDGDVLFRWKTYCCAVLCAGLFCVVAGGVLFFARSATAYREKTIEPMETFRLSAFTELDARHEIRLCAHRGLSATAPENTLESVRAAGEAGYPLILLDVTLTKDGEAVLLADETIERMTAGHGRVRAYTYTQLLRFPLDNGANLADFGRVQIPRLQDALELCESYGMQPVLSLRTVRSGISETLLRQLQSACMVVSSRRDVLESLAGQIDKLCLRVDALHAQDARYAAKHGFSLAFDPLQTSGKAPKEAGRTELWAWPVNTRETLVRTVGNGVKNVVTDCILPMSEK